MMISHRLSRPRAEISAAVLMILIGLGLRASGLGFVSFDMKDWLLPWYDQLAAGGFSTLATSFSNYTPPYLYLLLAATRTQSFLPEVAAIKLISIAFDLLNAWMIFRILRVKYPQGNPPLLGAAGFLLLPTVLLNSAFWGQADSIYTFFVLTCLYFLLKDRPLPALIFLGISFSFKAQAVFLAPLLLLLTVRRRIPWFYFAVIPVVYVVMMIPALIAGRPFMDVMTIYVAQSDTYASLSMHAPTLYNFVPAEWRHPALITGFLVTFLVICLWTWMYARRVGEFTPDILMLCALASAALVPFFLPKMHDRYFYLADVFSFLVAMYIPRLWYLAVGYQVVSGMAYSVFLVPSITLVKRRTIDTVLAWSAVVNTIVMAGLVWVQWLATDRHHRRPDTLH